MNISCLALGLVGANCYILSDPSSGEGAVVDPGAYTEELPEKIREQGVKSLKYILLTHGHFDHVLGVSMLKNAFPEAQIAISAPDAASLFDKCVNLLVSPDTADADTFFGEGANQLFRECEKEFFPCKADILLSEGDEIKIGHARLKVMETPGHSEGGLCFVCPDDRFVITGDTLFCRTAGRTDLPGGDAARLYTSVDKIMTLPDEYTIFPGHNRSTSIGDERAHNRYLRTR